MNYNFNVQTIEAGQRYSYGDSFYHYKITTSVDEYLVKQFCMNVLRESYEKINMPHPFAGELVLFEKLIDNNQEKPCYKQLIEQTYVYKVKSEFSD